MKRVACLFLSIFLLVPVIAMARTQSEIDRIESMAKYINLYFQDEDDTNFDIYYSKVSDFFGMTVTQNLLSYDEFKNLCKYGNDFLKREIDLTKTTLSTGLADMMDNLDIKVDVVVKVVSNDEKLCFLLKNGTELTVPLDLLYFD